MASGNLTLSLLRPDDLLALKFEFVNLTLDTVSTPPALVRIQPEQPAFIIVGFPPQHLAEKFFIDGGAVPGPADGPVDTAVADNTRLAFQVPDAVRSVPFTVASLLEWTQFKPSLPANALTAPPLANPPGISPPDPNQTAIELPMGLILSPNSTGGWKHTTGAATHNGRTELWHTRLGVTAGNDVDESRRPVVRAVWSPEFASAGVEVGALDSNTRKQIVRLSSDFTLTFNTSQAFSPVPLDVQRLMLSALGAWTDVGGSWDLPYPDPGPVDDPFSLALWRQVIAAGRDQYVRVVTRGFICPFGHRAALFTVIERELESAPDGTLGEYLMQREVVAVTEPCRDYTSDVITNAYTHGGRELPFKRVCLTTLAVPAPGLVPPDFPRTAGGAPFQFHLTAIDRDDRTVDFTMPLMFVDGANADQADFYTNIPTDDRTAEVRNQTVAFARSNDAGDTHLNTHLKTTEISFAAQLVSSLSPPFLPELDTALVAVHAIDLLLGASGASGATQMKFHDAYLNNEFDPQANSSEIFASLLGGFSVAVPADKAASSPLVWDWTVLAGRSGRCQKWTRWRRPPRTI